MHLSDLLHLRLQRRQCAAFVGAGFSMPCGMPSWGSLLRILLKTAKMGSTGSSNTADLQAAESALRGKNYALAASVLREVMPSAELDAAVLSAFDLNAYRNSSADVRKRMSLRMKNLASGPWAGIITTNYDQLIEYGLGKWTDGEVIQTSGSDRRLGTVLASPDSAKFFVKLHGSLSASQIVLTTEEYDRTYLCSPQVTEFLTAVMLRYHLVFIGCSLEDEIMRLRRKLTIDFSGNIPMAYAILHETDENVSRAQWLKKYTETECIMYPKEDTKHFGVDSFLAASAKDNVFPGIDRYVLSTSARSLSKQAASKRLKHVGSVNLELLRWVADSPTGLTSAVVVDPSSSDTKPPSLISSISPEERYYRVLFLVSIGLLLEKSRVKGTAIYEVPHRLRQELMSR